MFREIIDWWKYDRGLFIFWVGVISVFGLIFTALYFDVKEKSDNLSALKEIGYNSYDVKAFVKNSNYSYKDLLHSSAVQLQFEKFLNGEDELKPKQKSNTSYVPVIVSTG